MTEYRIDTTPSVAQRTELYLQNVGSIKAGTDVTFFFDLRGNIMAIAPVSANIAYVEIGTEYRIDTTVTGVQRPIVYLHNISTIIPAADITYWIDQLNNIIAIAPVSANIAYVSI